MSIATPQGRLRAQRGFEFGQHGVGPMAGFRLEARDENPLETYFDRHITGPGIWKWRHYFDIYHRHLARFVGREVHVVEVGVYSGGSLTMWRDYFGPECHVYGVDIEPACRAYENDSVSIFIGDQGDPAFWRELVDKVPRIDVVIDDGSHVPAHQIVTLEALLPRIQPGGVYLCEDVLHPTNEFHDYVNGLARNLHWMGLSDAPNQHRPTDFQHAVHSIHLYPYVTVVEVRSDAIDMLEAPKHGTEWQPFFDVSTPSG